MPASTDIMPQPFSWIHIPAGTATIDYIAGYMRGKTVFDVPEFYIGKYLVTNAQYRLFVEAGGYADDQWWTQTGLSERQKGGWKHPLFWHKPEWTADDYPVTGVSWYEAVAFCRWMSAITGEHIMLPTQPAWVRAAQGDDGRVYPWGNAWDKTRCNNNELKLGKTTPVKQFEGLGDSPYGVVDMAGNLSEWCSTNWMTGSDDPEGSDIRVFIGASWLNSDKYRCEISGSYRIWQKPHYRYNLAGFRLARLP
ncbi:MAG: formylglycine-generating enzyme family protein [Anaerolineae bacterium]|nr:formylglycine-generating enzyme family protein [Anaerolineae bacterium]